MSAANRHLCDGSCHREAEYKAMTAEEALNDILDTVQYYFAQDEIKKKILNNIAWGEDNTEIQHVGYDEEQCGRTK